MEHTHKCAYGSEVLHLSKFSIQVFPNNMCCEECGVVYKSLYNFCIVACCSVEKRLCSTCDWESIPCKTCRENKTGNVVINKKKNPCLVCKEEKKVYREIEERKKNIQNAI